MEGLMTITQEEACEAMRAYLIVRGVLPAHGTVKAVKDSGQSGGYHSGCIDVETKIDAPPATQVDKTFCA